MKFKKKTKKKKKQKKKNKSYRIEIVMHDNLALWTELIYSYLQLSSLTPRYNCFDLRQFFFFFYKDKHVFFCTNKPPFIHIFTKKSLTNELDKIQSYGLNRLLDRMPEKWAFRSAMKQINTRLAGANEWFICLFFLIYKWF